MFKLLLASCLLAAAMAAPADVVASKTVKDSVTVNQNNPLDPTDDTVVKQKSVSETVAKTDGSLPGPYPPGFDKNSFAQLSALYNLYGFNPLLQPYGYSPLYANNPYYPYNPYTRSPFYPGINYPAYPSYPSYPKLY